MVLISLPEWTIRVELESAHGNQIIHRLLTPNVILESVISSVVPKPQNRNLVEISIVSCSLRLLAAANMFIVLGALTS